MTSAAIEPKPSRVLPFHDPSRRRRLKKVGLWLLGTAVAIVLLHLLGIDVLGWLQDLWDQIKAVPAGYIAAGLLFQTGVTTFAAVSYYGILSAAYPGEASFPPILTAYAVGVAMNGFLPANIGTFVTLLMFVAIIPACTFAGGDRRLPRAEDLLHDRGDVRLPLPVPLRPGLLQREPREPDRAPGPRGRRSWPGSSSCSSSSAASSGSR